MRVSGSNGAIYVLGLAGLLMSSYFVAVAAIISLEVVATLGIPGIKLGIPPSLPPIDV